MPAGPPSAPVSPSPDGLSPESFAAATLGQLRLNKYIAHFPTAKQAYAMLLPHQEVFFGGSAGPGKMVHLDTELPTPSGWVTMRDIQEGQVLFDERGQPCQVVAVGQVVEAPVSYRLTFDDGSTIDACADHQWLTFDARELGQLTRLDPEWRAARRARRPSRAVVGESAKPWLAERNRLRPPPIRPAPTGTVRTTAEIAKTLTVRQGTRANHAIPVTKPLDLPDADLMLDPYLLGAWLGDGTSYSGTITGLDPTVWEQFALAGFTVTHGARTQSFHYVQDLLPMLRQLGVYRDKHIPQAYLRASYVQRLALLTGLMDTDGHATRTGDVEFTNTNKRLVDGVYELIVSLGWKVRLQEGRAKLYGKDCGPKWRLNWVPSTHVFRIPRKREAQRLATRRTTQFRYIVACDPTPPVPMRCIAVDSPSHLYLAGRQMVPTHNSDWLLMSALQYADVPGYSAILFRRTFVELALPDALMERAHTWLRPTDAKWLPARHTYVFPSGATLVFSHLEHEASVYAHQSAAYQYVGFDELTTFTEMMYRFLFSRLRRLRTMTIPLRMRSASNPGGAGHSWVRNRFMVEKHPDRAFVPARQMDNPFLDVDAYEHALAQLDPITRARLRNGDWDVAEEGTLFQRHWFPIVTDWPRIAKVIRFWDLAGSTPQPRARASAGLSLGRTTDPDYTVGTKVAEADGRYWVLDVKRSRLSPKGVEDFVRHTAQGDGTSVQIWMEQEPGAAGKSVIDHYRRRPLKGFVLHAIRSTGSKTARAQTASSAAEARNVSVLSAPWNEAWFEELALFPNGAHDDQVDSFSGAFNALSAPTRAGIFGRKRA